MSRKDVTEEEKKILEQILSQPKKEKQPILPPPPPPQPPVERLVKINAAACDPRMCQQQCAGSCPINIRLVMKNDTTGRPCMKIGAAGGKMEIDRELCCNCKTCIPYCPLRAIYFH